MIQLAGYTEDEKVAIARRYLVPKQLAENGLTEKQATFTERALRLVVREYTREAGVRSLERQIAALCRKTAAGIAAGKIQKARIDERRVRAGLGPQTLRGRDPQADKGPRRRHRPCRDRDRR